MRPPADARPRADAQLPPPLRVADPSVLVVEDEPRMRELLLRAITGWGFDAAGARSGEEALRLAGAAATPFEVVVLDLNLPGMDGMEFLGQLRRRHPARPVQAIVLTGYGSLEAARQAIHLDVVEFLTKPCRLGELERALDRAIRRLPPPEPPTPLDLEDGGAASARGAVPMTTPSPDDPGAAAGAVTLEEVERRHILETLARHNGNRTATAAELGISRRTLYYKLSEYQRLGFAVD